MINVFLIVCKHVIKKEKKWLIDDDERYNFSCNSTKQFNYEITITSILV